MSIEYATGHASRSLFPAAWSERQAPPTDPVGVAAWIASNVRGAQPLLPGIEVRATRPTDPRVARVELLRRRATL